MTTEERKQRLEELRKNKGVQSTGVQPTPTSSSSRAERLAQLRSKSTPTTTPVRKESGVLSALGKFGKGVYRDFASSVIAPARGAITGSASLLAGDTAGAQKEVSGYYDPILKEQVSNPFAKKQGVGEFTANVVKGGANAFQLAPLSTGVKTGGALMSEVAGSGGINALKRLVGAGAKEGLAYAPSTALYSGASTALEGGDAKDVLKSTAIGLALSPALGVTGSVLGGGLEKATRGTRAKLGSEVAQQARKQAAIPKAQELTSQAFDIRATKAQQKLEKKTGRTIEEIVVDEQLPVGRKETKEGVVLDTLPAIPVVEQKLSALDTAMSNHLKTQPQRQFDLKKLGEDAIKKFGAKEKGSTEFKEGKKAIEDAINDFGNDIRYGQMTGNGSKVVSGEELRAQKGSWGKSAWRTDNPQSQKALKTLYESANEIISKTYNDPIITDLNARMAELINAGSFLKAADNKVIRGGLLNQKIDQAANSLLGGLIGSTIEQVPVAGPVVGSLVGRGLTKIVGEWKRDPARLSKKAIDILRKAGVKSSTDELLERSAKVLNDLATKGKTTDTTVMNALKKAAQASKKGTVVEGKIINTAGKNEEAFGALGGFETYKDEKGNTKVRFNEKKALAGMALMSGITNPKVQSALKTVSDDLIKEAKKYKTPEEFVKARTTNLNNSKSSRKMILPENVESSTGYLEESELPKWVKNESKNVSFTNGGTILKLKNGNEVFLEGAITDGGQLKIQTIYVKNKGSGDATKLIKDIVSVNNLQSVGTSFLSKDGVKMMNRLGADIAPSSQMNKGLISTENIKRPLTGIESQDKEIFDLHKKIQEQKSEISRFSNSLSSNSPSERFGYTSKIELKKRISLEKEKLSKLESQLEDIWKKANKK